MSLTDIRSTVESELTPKFQLSNELTGRLLSGELLLTHSHKPGREPGRTSVS